MKPSCLRWALLGLAVLAAFFWGAVPRLADTFANRTRSAARLTVSPRAAALHQTLAVADLHDDLLLWPRDPGERHAFGHADLPRLRDSNVALQVFSVVNHAYLDLKLEGNPPSGFDPLCLLGLAARWPRAALTSRLSRALYQAGRLERLEKTRPGELMIVRTRDDLERLAHERQKHPGLIGGLLALEGVQPLEGKLENVDVLFAQGYRMFGITHFVDNEFGSSAHGTRHAGLTELGKLLIPAMEQKGITVDVAHASGGLIDDVLAIAKRPVVVSHTGVRGVCDNNRNLDDRRLKAIAAQGGVIGVGLWEAAVCDRTLMGVVRTMAYLRALVGIEHVALGSDFDGTTTTPIDAGELVQLTEALMRAGFTDRDIRLIMGGNVLRLLSSNLPR